MTEYKLGLTPGVIAGGVIIILILTVMLASTVYVVWRSRPSATARATRRRKSRTTPDPERAPRRTRIKPKTRAASPNSMYGDEKGDTSVESDADPPSPMPATPQAMHFASPSIPSTLNVILSPSVPHLVKLGAGGALEVRVTPPSPVLLPRGGNVRLAALPGGTPGENDSVWWVI